MRSVCWLQQLEQEMLMGPPCEVRPLQFADYTVGLAFKHLPLLLVVTCPLSLLLLSIGSLWLVSHSLLIPLTVNCTRYTTGYTIFSRRVFLLRKNCRLSDSGSDLFQFDISSSITFWNVTVVLRKSEQTRKW